ncbi:polycystic kidney disease protein 1-like 2 [Gigantopelta aegis]|uniref:polycystic kidney disease protein 1-like 2 n=1 Tax=Gigantopelta aegis TaxID=1735272 RepID=UPI001B888060|nr:polycystic kidney disease protein 1-like 2 [Gigantopelta aegis]
MDQPKIVPNTDGTLKRVHTEVSDFLSSDEESMKSKTSVKKSKVISSQNWPRFLVISSTDDGALNKLSPFAIQKAIVGLADTLLDYANKDTISLKLPASPQSNRSLQLTVHISDCFDTSTIVSLRVQVQTAKSDVQPFLEWLNDVSKEAVQERPSDFLEKALGIVGMLETVQVEANTTIAEKITIIRERLLNGLNKFEAIDKEMLFQMSDLINKLIAHGISPTMENPALSVSTYLAHDLNRTTDCQASARNIAKIQCNTLVTLMNKQVKEDTEYKQIEVKNKPVLNVLQAVSDCVLKSVPSVMEGPLNLQSDEVSLTVQRTEPTVDAFHITADPVDDGNPGGSVFFPNDMKHGRKKPFDLQMMIIKKNPFQWSPTADDVNLPVMKISVKNDGKSLNPSDLTVPADIFISKGQIIHGKVESHRQTIDIGIQTFTVECSYWSEAHEEWRQDGCMVSPFTTVTSLHCWCSHLTVFSGGVFVSPNTVDPIGDIGLFLTFFDNPVVVALIVGVWILFSMLLHWARRVDQKDLRNTGITMLDDNVPEDRYVYMICVVTGWWVQAGTTSRVFMYLCGKNGLSSRHALFSRSKDLFTSGAENWFLLKTTRSLGHLRSVVIWHDNSGHQPSWYLKEIVVKDVQTEEVWHCLYDEWLSLDKGLGTLQADIPAIADATFAKKRFYQFMHTTSRDFRNGHIWISIFSKPPASRFMRTQRLMCALCILLSTMLTNIMFHGIPRDDPEYQVDYGDFHLSLVDFVIGIESALIVFPINLIIILLFKLTKLKPDTVLESGEPVDDTIKLHKEKKNICSKFRLPWYFIYVAYFIAITTSLVCSYFVMLYGLKYGYNKSLAWVISFFTSFFQSALVTEPVKVLAVAFLLTMIFRQNMQYDSGKQQQTADEEDEFYVRDDYTKLSPQYIIPVSQHLLRNVRTRIIMDQRTWEILMEILLYFTFVAIVLLVVLGHSDVKESYSVTNSIENIYIRTFEHNRTKYFYKVTDSHTMWEYLNETFLENVSGFSTPVSHKVSFLVGRTRLRQIRIHKGPYTKNWENETTDDEITMWTYQSGSKLNTLPIMGRLDTYPGGGYVLQLPRHPYKARELIEGVKKTKWIDERTRVVFVEFTLFNPNVQLFTVVVLMFEYSNTGFVFPYHLIYTANFYHYQNEFETFVALVEILFVIYLFIFTCAEFKKFRKMSCRDYFNEPWTFVELTILCLAYSTIALFISRLLVCNHLMDTFADSDFEKFANFHTAAFHDSLLRYVMSSLIMLVIIKFFKLLRFNVRLSMLAKTLHSARGPLIAYSFSLFGFTMAFATFAVLVFGTTLEGYRNFPSTVTTMFLFMMGESDYYGLYEGNAVLGPLFFFLFSLTFQFILVQYFITLLMDSFHATRIHIASVKTEVHMVQYILRKLRLITMLDSHKKQGKRKIVEDF